MGASENVFYATLSASTLGAAEVAVVASIAPKLATAAVLTAVIRCLLCSAFYSSFGFIAGNGETSLILYYLNRNMHCQLIDAHALTHSIAM